jgi:hypothetical protein
MYTLTRFLYPLDEVELSFIHCLLNKANLQECYFWIFEIHFSGFDVFPFLWKVYLDFYKELNPLNLEDYIIKKNEDFLGAKDNDVDIIIKSIASIVRNLFKAVPSPNTFFLRQYFAIYNDDKDMNNEDDDNNDEMMMLLVDNINLLTINNNDDKNDDAGCQPLLNAIDKSDFEKVCYYLYDSSSSSIINIISLLSPFSSNKKSSLVYSNPLHYLLALCIINKKSNNNNTINKTIFVAPTEADLKMIRDINEMPIALSKYGLPQIYNTLKIKRLFSISANIGCFNLKRYSFIEEGSSYSDDDNYIDFLTEIWNHWEYYAMRSPLWLSRLPKECSIDHLKREIVFPSLDDNADADDIKEQFYELYGYELDEQSKEVMDMSHKEIWPASYSINDWLDCNANASSNINLYYLIRENISFNY